MNMISNELISIGGLMVEVTRKSGMKNLYIRVKPPDGKVTVSAPMNTASEEITHFVMKRTPDILRVRERMLSQFRQSKREYVSGEACYLWGKPYMLMVRCEGRNYRVYQSADRIIMIVPDGASCERRERLMLEWYRSELKRVIPAMLRQCEDRIGVKAASCSIRYMKTRWGSCNTQSKRILINLQLVKKPVQCLEYVIIHELVHLLERNHTNRFRSLVEKFCPNWKESKRLLNEYPLDYMKNAASCPG